MSYGNPRKCAKQKIQDTSLKYDVWAIVMTACLYVIKKGTKYIFI